MKTHITSQLIGLLLIFVSSFSFAGTTAYGKITGIETRDWGLHIQTSFGYSREGCEAIVGGTYMYDFVYGNNMNSSSSATVEVSILLAAFAAQKNVAFHIYDCNTSRPKIGYILVK
jgi:hypothetical protein